MTGEVDAKRLSAGKERTWGTTCSPNIDMLIKRIAPTLQSIKETCVSRESRLALPYQEMNSVKKSGLLSARLEDDYGGLGATLPDLFELIIIVAEADPNIAQALRSHFGFVEHILTSTDDQRKKRWLRRLSAGDLVAAAATEGGVAKQETFGTKLTQVDSEWRLNGTKAYATGALFSDWIEVEASADDAEGVAVLVSSKAPGVSMRDDWDGFGQKLSASGTIHLDNVFVQTEEMTRCDPFPYYESFYQLYLLAIIAGIGRSASNDVSSLLASRRRAFSHGTSIHPNKDPQLLQTIGEVRSAAYAAGAVVVRASHTLQRIYELYLEGSVTENEIARADIEVWQAQHSVPELVLSATSKLFDALGGSATSQRHGLDRHWRNARTLASHNPAAYKARIVGDYAVNDANPPGQWRIGIPNDTTCGN